MFVYSEQTSRVTREALDGMSFKSPSFLRKSLVSVCTTLRCELSETRSGLRMQRCVQWGRHLPILSVFLVPVIHFYVFSVAGIVVRFWVCVQ